MLSRLQLASRGACTSAADWRCRELIFANCRHAMRQLIADGDRQLFEEACFYLEGSFNSMFDDVEIYHAVARESQSGSVTIWAVVSRDKNLFKVPVIRFTHELRPRRAWSWVTPNVAEWERASLILGSAIDDVLFENVMDGGNLITTETHAKATAAAREYLHRYQWLSPFDDVECKIKYLNGVTAVQVELIAKNRGTSILGYWRAHDTRVIKVNGAG